MKFAFIIMGSFNSEKDRAKIHQGKAQIIGVSSIEEACAVAQELYQSGIDCIELCGAFGEKGADRVITATSGKIPVGYVVHLPEQDPLFDALFGRK